jgi:hypothetical protein
MPFEPKLHNSFACREESKPSNCGTSVAAGTARFALCDSEGRDLVGPVVFIRVSSGRIVTRRLMLSARPRV